MADDLFGAAAEQRMADVAPLATRLRPRTLGEVVGQDHLLGPGGPLRVLIETDRLRSVVLWGPPGTGKTTIARLIAAHTDKAFHQLSAVTATVRDVRAVIEAARARLGTEGRGTILFLDEVHRFNRSQQDALLPAVEDGLVVLVGATTENPSFEVVAPLLSRSLLFRLEPLGADALTTLAHRGLEVLGARADAEALRHLVEVAAGDGRRLLGVLETAVALAAAAGRDTVGRADVAAVTGTVPVRYGPDEHYDVVSAFIKSIRGSDPDAGLLWLARMLEAGEDPRFIARRLIILASEDVGMADPLSLLIAEAAARAVDHVGLPEAALNLAQAVVHLATAPKSNSVTTALGAARRDAAGPLEVPVHLRDASYPGARRLGHGAGYRYPHADPAGWVPQQHRPAHLEGRVYYQPTHRGHEARIAERLRTLRAGGGPTPGRDPAAEAGDPERTEESDP